MPRRSSTRTSRIVSSPTRAAPGLKTEFAGYGTSVGGQDRVRRPSAGTGLGRSRDHAEHRGHEHAGVGPAQPRGSRRPPRMRTDVLERRSATSGSTRRPGCVLTPVGRQAVVAGPARRIRDGARRGRSRRGTRRRRVPSRRGSAGRLSPRYADSAASSIAVASIGCWSNLDRSPVPRPPAVADRGEVAVAARSGRR